MNPEIFNLYVEKLINAVTELTKTNLLLSAQITYYERLNSGLNSKVDELQKSLDKALDKANSKQKKTSDTEF
jgi:chaperonin cofactor prefoldin